MPPRIALLTQSVNGGVWTVTKFIAQVLRQYSDYDYDIFFLATSMRDPASVRLLAPTTWRRGIQVLDAQMEGIPYHHVGAFLVEFEFQRYQPRRVLTDLLKQYDLIQVVAGGPALAGVARSVDLPVCLFVATSVEKERATILQGTDSWHKYWRAVMTKVTNYLEKQALCQVSAIFAESYYTLDLLRTYVRTNLLMLGIPGVDTHFFTPPPSYNADGYWLWVGRLNEPRKNIPLLLEAYARLVRVCPSVPQLILVGRGEWSPKYSTLLGKFGITERVQIISDASAEQLAELYRSASVFVLSSNEEGLGMVILEAMASGLPVISTDCGGPATAIVSGETGLLIPVGDAPALAEAMRMLWEQPALRQRMGQEGRQRVEEHFSIEKAGQVYLDTYARLLERRHSLVRD